MTVRRPFFWLGAALASLAVAATTTGADGAYIADNRFEQYFAPGRRLAHTLTLWDGTRGLGRVREDFWPGVTLPIALFRSLGASPALAEQLWHATLLT
ncbi:MAG: hypothetical protein AAGK32_13225, partial [Actinomycetota bacterium]